MRLLITLGAEEACGLQDVGRQPAQRGARERHLQRALSATCNMQHGKDLLSARLLHAISAVEKHYSHLTPCRACSTRPRRWRHPALTVTCVHARAHAHTRTRTHTGTRTSTGMLCLRHQPMQHATCNMRHATCNMQPMV